jgi:hypothetical protein
VLTEFEHELEEDLASVAVTLTAVTGVIIFWRGVWSLLDCESAPSPSLLSHPWTASNSSACSVQQPLALSTALSVSRVSIMCTPSTN